MIKARDALSELCKCSIDCTHSSFHKVLHHPKSAINQQMMNKEILEKIDKFNLRIKLKPRNGGVEDHLGRGKRGPWMRLLSWVLAADFSYAILAILLQPEGIFVSARF